VEERERCARELQALGLEPLPSMANFLVVPVEEA
jgi:histidinol-phosphate/aromatic aminotransferase/cobyric acid decarboxylase-like protein